MRNPVKKIAILNPYRQGGHYQIAESEAALRFIVAAKKYGIEVEVFAKSEELYDFEPDLVVAHTYQDPKLTHYPTYGVITMPRKWVEHMPRFMRNILTYDGFIVASSGNAKWLHSLCGSANKVPYIAFSAFSHPQESYFECDYSTAKAAYLGTNWDGSRHNDFFAQFTDGEYLQCFGPQKAWTKVAPAVYGGEVPFDGVSALATYRHCAIGLGINHNDFDSEGVPTSRSFEIPASGAVTICHDNAFMMDMYQDSVLYVAKNLSPEDSAASLIRHINWVRKNPHLAKELAQRANKIFNEQLSMEIFIENLLRMHEKFLKDNTPKISEMNLKLGHDHYFYPEFNASINSRLSSDKQVSYVVNVQTSNLDKLKECIDSIDKQSYKKVSIILLAGNELKKSPMIKEIIEDKRIMVIFSPAELIEHIKETYVGFILASDALHPYHTEHLLRYFNLNEKSIVYSGVAQRSDALLHENMKDESLVPRQERMRIGSFSIAGNNLNSNALDEQNFYLGAALMTSVAAKDLLSSGNAFNFFNFQQRLMKAIESEQFLPLFSNEVSVLSYIDIPANNADAKKLFFAWLKKSIRRLVTV